MELGCDVPFSPTGADAGAVAGTPLATVVGLVGGCGGAGASVLSAAVAVAATKTGRSALLVDADRFGGGIDLLVGAEDVTGLRWPDLAQARGHLGAGVLREALPRLDGLSVLSWDRGGATAVAPAAVDAVTGGAAHGFDVVVVDLSRSLDELAEPWLRIVDLALVVVPASVRAVAAAGAVVAELDARVSDLRLVVRGPAPARLAPELVAEVVGLPLLAELRPEPGLAAQLGRGEAPGQRPRSPLARCATRILGTVDRLRSEA